MYEYDGAQYVHWAAVAAIIVVLVYYVKQYYCPPEGYKGNPFMGAFDQTAAHIDKLEQDHPGLMLSSSGRTSIYGVPAINENAKYSEGFLAGREAPYIGPPAGLSAHTYNKAVHDVKKATAGFYEGMHVVGHDSGEMSSAKIGLTEDDAQYLLNQ